MPGPVQDVDEGIKKESSKESMKRSTLHIVDSRDRLRFKWLQWLLRMGALAVAGDEFLHDLVTIAEAEEVRHYCYT